MTTARGGQRQLSDSHRRMIEALPETREKARRDIRAYGTGTKKPIRECVEKFRGGEAQ